MRTRVCIGRTTVPTAWGPSHEAGTQHPRRMQYVPSRICTWVTWLEAPAQSSWQHPHPGGATRRPTQTPSHALRGKQLT